MRINTNILGLRAQGSLARTAKALSRAMVRLASGQRVNSAHDDAAGLSLGVGLDAQRRGLLQASRNIRDGRGFLETAESALSTQTQILLRMRELATMASNGTLTFIEREALNSEFQSLLEESNRIATQTTFNGTTLLDGSFSTRSLQVGTNKGNTIGINIGGSRNYDLFAITTTTGGDSSTTVGTGTFQARTTKAGESHGNSARVYDLNNDGKNDVIAANWDSGTQSVSIYLGNGNGTLADRTTVFMGIAPSDVQAVDLNGDGKLDLIATNDTSNTISIALGNGNGTFQTRTTALTGDAPYTMSIVDLNGDGKLDVTTVDQNDNTISVLLGNGNGTFQAPTAFASGGNPYWLDPGDLNGDGKLDFVVSNAGVGTVSILLGNGNGTFGAPTSVGVYSAAVDLSDFNGDGKLDMVSASTSGGVDIFLGNGNGTFGAQNQIATFITWGVIAQDLNGDNNIDIVSVNSGSNAATVFLGNGNGTFAVGVDYSTGTDPNIGLGDLNGDGVADIVSADYTSATLSILLANTTTVGVSTPASTTTALPTLLITTQEYAEDVLDYIDQGLATLANLRSQVGALVERLDFAENLNEQSADHISSARAQIVDADYAVEIAEVVRLQMLQQSGLAVLGKANLSTRLALKLLENL